MFRYHEWEYQQTPSFWKTFYKHPGLINIFAFINSVMAAKTAGYSTLQAYDILDIGEHVPGNTQVWEQLAMSNYVKVAGADFPHTYSIPLDWLTLETLYDKPVNPEMTLVSGVDYTFIAGVVSFKSDIPALPLHVMEAVYKGSLIEDVDGVYITPTAYQNIGGTFPHQYSIDTGFTRLDRLFESVTGNTFWAGVDYVLSGNTIQCKNRLPLTPIYVSKGTRTSTRLNDDYGKLLGYSRYDSYAYRDNIVPLMAMFYVGPTYKNVKAAANVMVGYPVSKYDIETVINTKNGFVVTDKYKYDLKNSKLAVKVGDAILKHAPVADVVEVYTNETHPGWWRDRVVDLFQKYSKQPLDAWRRDQMMDLFLKNFLAHIRINLHHIDLNRFKYSPDVYQLILDAAPIRTDFIISHYYKVDDLDQFPALDVEAMMFALHASSLWTRLKLVESAEYLYAHDVVKARILEDNAANPDWVVGSHRYHILTDGSQFDEFWSEEQYELSYMEPNVSQFFYRTVEEPSITVDNISISSLNIPRPLTVKIKGSVNHKVTPVVISYIPKIQDEFTQSATSFATIAGDTVIGYAGLKAWTLTNTQLGVDGITCDINSSGSAVSRAIPLGMIPKSVSVRLTTSVPAGTSLSVFYNVGDGWVPLPQSGVIAGLRGQITFKVELTGSAVSFPVFKGMTVSVRA